MKPLLLETGQAVFFCVPDQGRFEEGRESEVGVACVILTATSTSQIRLSIRWVFAIVAFFEDWLNSFLSPKFIACMLWVFRKKLISLGKIFIDSDFTFVSRLIIAIMNDCFGHARWASAIVYRLSSAGYSAPEPWSCFTALPAKGWWRQCRKWQP